MLNLTDKFLEILEDKLKTKNKFILKFLRKLSKIDKIQKKIDDLGRPNLKNSNDFDQFLIDLNLNVKVHIPKNFILSKKQFLIVANHPVGPLDGFFLKKTIQEMGLNGKIICDDTLEAIDFFKEIMIGVPIRNDRLKTSSLKKIRSEIKFGNCIGIFPSGDVACFNFKDKKVSESPWSTGCIEIAKMYNLEVIPVYIDANKLSLFYYFLKAIHEDIGAFKLLSENLKFINKRKDINVYIGSPIDVSCLDPSDENAKKLRKICLELKNNF